MNLVAKIEFIKMSSPQEKAQCVSYAKYKIPLLLKYKVMTFRVVNASNSSGPNPTRPEIDLIVQARSRKQA